MSRPKAYSYTRFSTPEQRKGSSVARQEARARAFAEAHDLEIENRFDDHGVSAYRGKNANVGALGDFIGLVERGEIAPGSYLLVESMDRLSRADVYEAMSLLLKLMRLGVWVAILDDGRIYRSDGVDSQMSLLIALVSMSRAHEESRRKSDMLSAAWRQKRERAREEGKVTTSLVPGWLKVVEGKVQEVPERCEVVREIFTLARDGYGAYSISRLLNERQEKPWSTRKNAVWRESYVKKILMSRTVLGEYQPHVVSVEGGKQRRTPSGAPLRGYYPEVVTPTLFQEVNEAVDTRRLVGRGRKGDRYANLFTGLLRCTCGAGLRFIDKGEGPKGGTYLQCSVSLARGTCGARTFMYSLVEDVLLNAVNTLDVAQLIGGVSAVTRSATLRTQLLACAAEESRLKIELNQLRADFKKSPGSPYLHTWLSDVESQENKNRLIRKQVESEQASLVRVDPEQWRETLVELRKAINENSGPDVGKKRRALGAELQRVIKKITLRDLRRDGWEIAEEYDSTSVTDSDADRQLWRNDGETRGWKELFGVKSLNGLNKLARQRSFDLRVEYKSGEVVHVDALIGKWYRSTKTLGMKNLEFKVRAVDDKRQQILTAFF